MHGLTQTSEETVSMAVDFVNGDVGVAVFCANKLLENVIWSQEEIQTSSCSTSNVLRVCLPSNFLHAVSHNSGMR